MREYNGTIYRPPVEAYTFLLPVTEGCSHNSCRFCSMYKDIPFRMLPLADVEDYLEKGVKMHHRLGGKIKRIYLVGADPFALMRPPYPAISNPARRQRRRHCGR